MSVVFNSDLDSFAQDVCRRRLRDCKPGHDASVSYLFSNSDIIASAGDATATCGVAELSSFDEWADLEVDFLDKKKDRKDLKNKILQAKFTKGQRTQRFSHDICNEVGGHFEMWYYEGFYKKVGSDILFKTGHVFQKIKANPNSRSRFKRDVLAKYPGEIQNFLRYKVYQEIKDI